MHKIFNAALISVAALSLCGAPSAWAQQKQKVSYKVGAGDSKYTQRHTLDVGDESGHQLVVFEIHRTFPSNAPVVNGIKLKEIWSRGYSDLVDSNGLSMNYSIYVLENGDRFYARTSTMGQADAAGKRSNVSVGHLLGGTGKVAGMKGMVRSTGVSDGKAGFNETQSEIEYWFAK